jgi:hypothetical protein
VQWEDSRGLKGEALFVNSTHQNLKYEELCLLNCSHDEDIRVRYVGLFIEGQIISLENIVKKDQALIAKYVEECYNIHGGSVLN